MRLHKSHTDAWSQQQMQAFADAMAKHLREDLPEHLERNGIADEELEGVIREGCTRAEQYDMTGEADLARFVEFMAILGPDFDSSAKTAWAGEILRREDLEPDARLDEIAAAIIFESEEPPVV